MDSLLQVRTMIDQTGQWPRASVRRSDRRKVGRMSVQDWTRWAPTTGQTPLSQLQRNINNTLFTVHDTLELQRKETTLNKDIMSATW